MGAVRKLLDFLYLAAGVLAAPCLIAILSLIVVQMIARWTGEVFPGAPDYAGYAMAATIARHLGEDRLVQVRDSVSGFVSAYQEAALMNPTPLPVPGRPGVSNNETMPPWSPEVFDWLMELLANEHN